MPWLFAVLLLLQADQRSVFDRMPEPQSRADMETAKRRAEQEEKRQFELRLRDFVEAWNEWSREYTDRGTFNLKKARKASALFEKLQDHGWPRR